MSPRLSWSKLVPGLIALGVIVAIAVGVLVFAGVGSVRGETLRLHVIANQVRGLMKGSDVWLGGQRVGAVARIDFLPPSTDTAARVHIVLDVEADGAVQIRRDSEVRIRAGGNVIGPIVVDIAAGSSTSPRVADGDTLRARSQSDFGNAAQRLGSTGEDLRAVMRDAKTAVGYVRDTSGSVGAMLSAGGGGAGAQASRLGERLSRLMERFSGSGRSGVAGPATVMASSRRALARVDSVRALIASSNTSYGRFTRDSTLQLAVADLRNELGVLQAQMDSQSGTLSRWGRDSAIVLQITNAQREMAELFADIRRRPMRYLAF